MPLRDNHICEKFISTEDILHHEIASKLKRMKLQAIEDLKMRDQMAEVILKNSEAFLWNPNELGATKLVQHSIPTGNAPPVVQKQYQIPSAAKESAEQQVNNMLKRY